MTKKEMFTTLTTLVLNSNLPEKDEILDKLSNEIAQLEKKVATPRKPSATQLENETFKGDIIAYLTANKGMYTIKDLQEKIPSIAGLSCQRMTHLITALGEKGANLIEKSYIKKVLYISAK